jgi:hypothetical protein
VAEVLGTEIRGQSHTNTAGKLVGRGNYPYRILAANSKQSGRFQHKCEVSSRKETSHRNGHSKVNDCIVQSVCWTAFGGVFQGPPFESEVMGIGGYY